ncbi:efflux RND transporter permease subunit, partial [Cronobacter sakazakii]|uniref:efflux RND transporter permease subunit n=1 Tax=Cronobacter sakazakii TaxID=28141 RepID=UPI003D01929C
MKFYALFIYRPVATILLSIAVTLCGVLGFRLLPVAPLPQVDFPVIMVSASLLVSFTHLPLPPLCG